MLRAVPLLAALILCACGTANVTVNAYQGVQKPDAQIAILAEKDPTAGLASVTQNGAAIWKRKANFSEQSIKGTPTIEQVKLEPGRYTVESLLWCASSYAYRISGLKTPNYLGIRHTDEVELLAGHEYEVRGQNVGYDCREGPKLWIEDKTAGAPLKVISSNEQTFSQ